MNSSRFPLQILVLVLLVALAAMAPACSGGGGGGGGDDDDDDDVLPTPTRPGFVVLRLGTNLTLVRADGIGLVDVPQSSDRIEFVGLAAGDRILYSVKASALATTSAIFAINPDGTGNTLLADDVSGVLDWADSTHLLVYKGPGPDVAFPPSRDIHLLGADGSDVPLAAETEDESFAGVFGASLVLVRGDSAAQDQNLVARPLLGGGTETALTSDGGIKAFEGFTASGRVVFRKGASGDIFSVPLTGGTAVTLADGVNNEIVVAIHGERVVFEEEVPVMTASQNDVYAVNSDGTDRATISATADFPDNVVGITDAGVVLVSRQTSFEPMNFTFDLVAVPIAGGGETVLSDITGGGVAAVDGETVFFAAGATQGELDIFAIESDGSGLRTLAGDAGDDVFLALVNDHVLFRAGTPEKVWSVGVNGGSPERLRDTSDGETFAAALGPVAVMTIVGAGGKTDLVAANTSGGGERTLAEDPDTETFRGMTPDGRVIYTLNKGIFLDDVLIVNADGTGMVNLTDRQDEDEFLGFLP